MPNDKFCKNCFHYEAGLLTRHGESFGICNNIIPSLKIIQDDFLQHSEQTVLYTEQYFGCIYHRERETTLIRIGEYLKGFRKKW